MSFRLSEHTHSPENAVQKAKSENSCGLIV